MTRLDQAAVMIVRIVPRGIYNLNRNNQNVLLSKPDQSWLKEDRPRSSYHLGLKSKPRLHLGLKRVEPEQLATNHQMNHVKNARLANPVPKEPPNAILATKESSVTKMAPPAKSAKQVPSKIKIHCQVYLAGHVQQDTTTTCPVKARAKT